jgi:hypothetical protein
MARKNSGHDEHADLLKFAPIEDAITTVRGERVILGGDLARIYGVQAKVLNQAVKRNIDKFPHDFMFQLTRDEAKTIQSLRSQIVTLNEGDNSRSQSVTLNEGDRLRSQSVILKQGQHLKYLPYAFTEHGAIMAANVLSSPQAVQMSVFVVRAFARMRAMLTDTRELARKLAALESELKARLDTHETAIVDVLQRVMAIFDPPPLPTPPPRRQIGFRAAPSPKKKPRPGA